MSAYPRWRPPTRESLRAFDSDEVTQVKKASGEADLPADFDGELEELLEQLKVSRGFGLKLAIRKLWREPLVHFLLAGTLLFGAGTLFSPASGAASQNRIHVSAAEVQRLRDVWSRQYGRTPDTNQLNSLIDEYVREEVLYREAIASGLDKDDTIIRRRVVEKMEFLSQEIASAPPSEAEIQEYFQANRENFRVPAQAAFAHIYFSPAKRSAAENDARDVLTRLRRHLGESSQFGDSFMLQSEYPAQTQSEVKALFGDEFAKTLFQLTPGQWEGPISSSYGIHLVRISQLIPSRVPELAEVRNQVLTDFKNERLQRASEAYYAQLRKKYRVDVDGKALAEAESQPTGQPVSHGAKSTAPDED